MPLHTHLTTRYRSGRRNFIGIAIALAFTGKMSITHAVELDVPYVQTPPEIVNVMLDMAKVTADDYVIDLGTGDGRIVIAAVQRGATGLGVDLDPERIAEANAAATTAGIADKVRFEVEDLFQTDLGPATVVTLFLNSEVNMRLRPTLLEKLKPGTRVVSHNFDMEDWQPDDYNQLMMNTNNNFYIHDVFLWIVPADIAGTWDVKIGNDTMQMTVEQQFQQINVKTQVNGMPVTTETATLTGDKLVIRAKGTDDRIYQLEGSITDNGITGTTQTGKGNLDWSATRH